MTLPASAGLAAAALTLTASAAFACTAVMGPLFLTPTSGHGGTVITTTAQGLKINATYAMHFATSTSGDCMSFTGVATIKKKIPTDGAGNWSNVTMSIPATPTMGTHSVCAMEVLPVKGQTGTQHMSFTIT